MDRMVFAVVLALLLVTGQPLAKPMDRDEVPQALRPWINWVLFDHRDYQCPILYNRADERRCGWPTRLELDIGERQASFTVGWHLFAETSFDLPGDEKTWPQKVTVNGQPGLVGERNGKPSLTLGPGDYRIAGTFQWERIPDSLAVPADSGLVALTINGKSVPFPNRRGDRLWLRESDTGRTARPEVGNTVELQVFRRITDDIPLKVLTRIDLDVSGDQREVLLGRALLPDFIPMGLDSPLPARLEPDGRLRLQVRPGRWLIELSARHPGEITSLPLTASPKPWPDSEVWSFDARSHQRLVEVEGVAPVDPRQTNLPPEWHQLPAYEMRPGDVMGFKIIRRGDPEPEPNALTLRRTLWLDFDGGGYTVNDVITGTMTQGWRLEANPEMHLGRVDLDGQTQLITRRDGTDRAGVEVRRGAINLTADSRVEGSIGALTAVGWHQDVQHLSALLNLPPGWRLFAATGVDNAPDTWLYRWTLLDLFVVMIASLAVYRLWDWRWGLCAVVAFALIWHEPGAPRFVWLHILAAIALLRVLPEGRFRVFAQLYRNLFLLGLVVIALPFMLNQVRNALYPQLEHPWQPITPYPVSTEMARVTAPSMEFQGKGAIPAKPAVPQAVAPVEDSVRSFAGGATGEEIPPTEVIDPNAIVQTGPGLPRWHWNRVELTWNGPVDASQQIRLIYFSPAVVMLTNFLRVVLVLTLALLVLGVRRSAGFPPLTQAGALPIWLFAGVLAMGSDDAAAEFPDTPMLEQLRGRLLAPPDCLPACAQIVQMRMLLSPAALQLKLETHASEAVAVPLPGRRGQWEPALATIDGVAAGISTASNGDLWLNLGAGRHSVVLEGPVSDRNDFSLSLPLRPRKVEVEGRGWQVEGIRENGVPDAQLRLTRLVDKTRDDAPRAALEPEVLPPFAHIERTLRLGLDWHLHTRVQRGSPGGTAIVLRVPLLPGESVTTAGVRVEKGEVLVNMAPQQRAVHWASVLEKRTEVTLTAPRTTEWTEIWRADIAPLWHIETAGIAVVHHQDVGGRWLPEWRPWPGESVVLRITRPGAVAGRTFTIDDSRLDVRPGKRSTDLTLALTLRSAKGGLHTVTLPAGARLNTVTIDGTAQPVRQQDRAVTLPVRPGAQAIALNWLQPEGLGTWFRLPVVDLGTDSVNSAVHVGLGNDRWVLLVGGPDFGPAVLFWGILLVLVLLAPVLGRIPFTPLKGRHWFLLLVGLSQLPSLYALLVVGWLIALGLRGRYPPDMSPWKFNLLQVGLGFLTVVAVLLLFAAVEQGLLGTPDMQIEGNQSTAYDLNWYQDRNRSELPRPWLVSLPLLAYQLLMLAWSLWLAYALLGWLRWGWTCFSATGFWRKSEKKPERVADEKPAPE